MRHWMLALFACLVMACDKPRSAAGVSTPSTPPPGEIEVQIPHSWTGVPFFPYRYTLIAASADSEVTSDGTSRMCLRTTVHCQGMFEEDEIRGYGDDGPAFLYPKACHAPNQYDEPTLIEITIKDRTDRQGIIIPLEGGLHSSGDAELLITEDALLGLPSCEADHSITHH
ncbi:hypothetical protein KBD61_00120 [Patescibacteria group bacterium]|nr:hypothetical protein [Patescibacteria group bacterium]MBP9709415.1 hypothetical protein [Patescibacteria group bacterium]